VRKGDSGLKENVGPRRNWGAPIGVGGVTGGGRETLFVRRTAERKVGVGTRILQKKKKQLVAERRV